MGLLGCVNRAPPLRLLLTWERDVGAAPPSLLSASACWRLLSRHARKNNLLLNIWSLVYIYSDVFAVYRYR